MLLIDKYANGNALTNTHPMEKAAFSFSLLLFTIITRDQFIALLTFFMMSGIVILKAKIPVTYYIKLLFLPFIFLITSVVTLLISVVPVTIDIQDPIWVVTLAHWKVYINNYGINQALQTIITVLASISCMYFLILTTPIHQIIWLFRKMKLPIAFIEITLFTYRFIFILLNKTKEIYTAQSSRIGYQTYKTWLSSLGKLIVSLFIKALLAAQQLQVALDSRGGTENDYEVELNQTYKGSNWILISFTIILYFFLYHEVADLST